MSERRQLRQATKELVEELGGTPDEVSKSLSSYGVRGRPRDSARCAVARYLCTVINAEPTVTEVLVTERELRLVRSGARAAVRVRLPKATVDFIRAFDAGVYPQLMECAEISRAVSPG